MHGIEDSKRAATLRAIWPAVLHAMRGNPSTVFWLATAAGHARRQAHELDPIAAEVLVAPSPFAATPPI